ncbi:MAG TPA: CaiB/BaiF CoA-transferase family protein [Chloroflexota bacterium]|nr:CaiB/BaiF CoA-transferase family protein [Chloroflexota bacterium]
MPLAGVRVVAWEHAVAAPLATRHLADLGADVIKVERPGGGDFARAYDSAVNGLSAHFVWLNRGKRSVVLDLKQPDGKRAFDVLLDRADVFVHNQGPGAAERLGCTHAELAARNPRVISCAISGYGPDGPHRDRKAYDLLLQGEAGVIALTGTPAEPAKVGISVADIASGLYAFSSVLAALIQRQVTGAGAEIQISMLESLVEWLMPAAYVAEYTGHPPARAGARHSFIVPYGGYAVGDGAQVNLAVQNDGQWRRLCAIVLRQPALADDPRFASNELRLANRDELEPLLESLLAGDTRASVEARLTQADVPFGTVNDVQGVLRHPQLEARARWFDIPSAVGPLRALHHPMNIQGLARPAGSVPALGEHTAEVLAELGL